MDIFTTQLTRVVPVPIKPANLKVKALLKEAAANGLSHDPNHLENHEYYFTNEDDQYHSSKQESAEQEETVNSTVIQDNTPDDDKQRSLTENKNSGKGKVKDKHLDLYA